MMVKWYRDGESEIVADDEGDRIVADVDGGIVSDDRSEIVDDEGGRIAADDDGGITTAE